MNLFGNAPRPSVGPPEPPSFFIPLVPPRVSRTLIAINLLVFAVTFLYGLVEYRVWNGPTNLRVLFDLGMKSNWHIMQGQSWRLFTAMFLHIGPIHLISNLIGLFWLGPIIEGHFGHFRFAVIYLLGGLLGSIASYAFSPALSAGASGAVFALLGATIVYFYRFRDNMGRQGQSMLQSALVLLTHQPCARLLGHQRRQLGSHGRPRRRRHHRNRPPAPLPLPPPAPSSASAASPSFANPASSAASPGSCSASSSSSPPSKPPPSPAPLSASPVQAPSSLPPSTIQYVRLRAQTPSGGSGPLRRACAPFAAKAAQGCRRQTPAAARGYALLWRSGLRPSLVRGDTPRNAPLQNPPRSHPPSSLLSGGLTCRIIEEARTVSAMKVWSRKVFSAALRGSKG